ncbi:MAG: V-type ATPase 116kDa subunit family protein [Sharpea porci]|uniref:V-type ATP synthase subunit I n=1 Tax=Sharpea porci TaxID=2652286 RepID=UPI00240A9011|nr:V-type ATPase 116kDa subunit family protein [Sharpea porci]MDD6712154.1 V-type ATPase 116kDa subunit family protein [Sharpea porci]
MAIAKLKLLEIEFPVENVDVILDKLVDSTTFHPELASKFADGVRDITVMNVDNPYGDIAHRIEDACKNHHLELDEGQVGEIDVEKEVQFLNDFVKKFDDFDETKRQLLEMMDENAAVKKEISHMVNSGINFDYLFDSHYLQIRIGHMPSSSLTKLEYYENQEFLYKVFEEDTQECYIMYITTRNKAPEIDNIFSTLFFKRVRIPEFVHGSVEDAIVKLDEETNTATAYLEDLKARRANFIEENKAHLSKLYASARELNRITEAKKYVVVFGKSAAIYGFATVKDANVIKEEYEKMDHVRVDLTPPMSDYRLKPPTKLVNHWFAKPFGMFVEMYGVPNYTDMDPTNFVALTYCILFGIMFGDVGQGAMLILFGYLMSKFKGFRLGEVGVRIGIFSIIMGIIFGSVFGNETMIKPFFVPLKASNTMTLLATAVAIGAVLIIITISFNTYMNGKKKNWGEFLFSQNGLAGLVFYLAVIALIINMVANLHLPLGRPFVVFFVVVPILLMFLKEPLTRKLGGYPMFPDGFGAFFTEGFFELFDVLLTFITNTVSYLRVGGFVLSHAGMMLVVYTLAGMVGGFGYWIVLVLGNIFVMVLEGMIVGIQVLRLEFYEMFSRYYEGGGRPFESMKEALDKAK